MTRLIEHVRDQHAGVRSRIANELNPASFKIFDVLLLILIRLSEETDKLSATPLSANLAIQLQGEIRRWLGEEVQSQSATRTTSSEVCAGVGGDSALDGLVGLFLKLKGDIRYATHRKTEVVEYRLRRLPELLDLCNRVIDDGSRRLFDRQQKEWIVVLEDLDKTGISSQQLQERFIQYGSVFQSLRLSMILTIPVWLGCSHESNRLPFEKHMIHDTPGDDAAHHPHEEGRNALREILTARVSPHVFAEGQMERLVVASGGNLRDLFAMVLDAGEGAPARDNRTTQIDPAAASAAINKMRRDYRMRLGTSSYDLHPISFADKQRRLKSV